MSKPTKGSPPVKRYTVCLAPRARARGVAIARRQRRSFSNLLGIWIDQEFERMKGRV